MKAHSPCAKDCPERNASCHASCEKYIAYREQKDAELEARNKAVSVICDIYTARKERYWKEVRRGRRKLN